MGKNIRFMQDYRQQPTEVRQVMVEAEPAWSEAPDDGSLLLAVRRTIERNLEIYPETVYPVVGVDVQAWRPAAYEETRYGFEPVGRGRWGRNFNSLRSAQVIEAQVEIVYDLFSNQ